MRFFDAFAGVGGFHVGIQRASGNRGQAEEPSMDGRSTASATLNERFGEYATCVGYSEIDKYAIKVYERNFKTDRTTEEIKADLDSIKTILSDENYGILEVCYVNIAESGQTSIKTTNQSVETALKDTSLSGDSKIKQLINNTKKGLEFCSDNECLICTEMSVAAVESQSQSFSHLNTEMAMDTSTEKNMELAICINSPSKFTTQKNTKSYATTVITQKGDTAYAHINRRKPIRNFGDITKINEKELPDFDCLVGGFPCQAFSIAGKRRGFLDTRGTLFFDIARILRVKKPRTLVLENVKGLLSHDGGNTFRTIIATLTELGYDVQWQVLNSKDFGVPQNRERVYIVGHLRGTPRPEVFPIESDHGETSNEVTAKGRLVRLTRREEKGFYDAEDNRASTLDANYYKGLANQERPGVKINVVGMLNDETWKKRNESIRRGRVSDIAPTVDTGMQLHTLTEDVRIRRLTPLETERLQGFPDNWTKEGVELCTGKLCDAGKYDGCLGHFVPISDSQRYKMCGNAVTTNVVQAVFERLLI